MAIYDYFTYNGELDMLRFRIELLSEHVDKFIVAEANLTHTGRSKEFTLENYLSEFGDKVTYLKVNLKSIDDIDLDPDMTGAHREVNGPKWILENSHRMSLLHLYSDFKDEDIFIIGDLDEIPNLELYMSEQYYGKTVSCAQKFFYYYADFQSIGPMDPIWLGSVILPFSRLKNSNPQMIRNTRNTNITIYPGGYHFSYFGGEKAILKKINSIVEAKSIMKEKNITVEKLLERYRRGEDIYGREGVNFKKLSEFDFINTFSQKELSLLKKYKFLLNCD